ncbi:hypothetical protein Tco_1509221 [Tanacetum coccineum]
MSVFNCNEKMAKLCHSDCPNTRFHDAKYFREQMLLAMKDEAGSNLNDEENDFMLDNSFRYEALEELTAAVIMMARIQPTADNGVQKGRTMLLKGVGSSNSVRRPKSKDTKSKNRVLKNTNARSSSAYVRKTPSSVMIDSNKHKTKNLNECQSNANVLNTKNVTAVNDGSNLVIQLVLWIVDSGCSKHMTGILQLLRNFIEKFMGTVRFRNDHFAAITGYGDYVQDNLMICHVYYVEGLGHNLFSVGKFYDGYLEVAFRSNTCYVKNLERDDLLTSSRESNLYTISISEMAVSSPMCLISKATSTKSWLWHCML